MNICLYGARIYHVHYCTYLFSCARLWKYIFYFIFLGLKINSTESMSLAFSSEQDLEEHLHFEDFAVLNILAGIVFDQFPTDGSIPHNFTYKIR